MLIASQQLLTGKYFVSEMKPNYKIGLGRADITGPAADVNMVSLVKFADSSKGITVAFAMYS